MASVAGPKSVSCDICKRSFNSTTLLLSHCEKYHNDEYTPLKCNICNCTFRCNDELKEHLKKCGKSEAINKPSISMEDSAEIVFKPITLLQSQGILFKDLTFECPFIDCSTTFSSTQFTSWVEEIKLMEFPLDVEVLKNVIRIEYIIGKALEDSSAAGFSEEQRNYWKNAHSYLSDLSKRHLKQ